MQLRLREGSVRWRPLAIAAAAVILVAAASSNAKPAAGPVGDAGNSDGVTSTSVTIGGIASQSGPIAADFSGIIDGVSAYLDMVNASGGVDGRKILYPVANQLDDAGDPSSDENAARTLVQQDHVFAIVGVGTPNFAAYSYLVPQGVPTFGYAVGPEWSRGDNLFGAEGSYIDFLSPGPEPAFLAQQVHATKVGLLAYSVTASHDACTGFGSVLHRFGIDTVFQDLAIPAPALDLSSDVIRMRSAGVQMVISCMDISGNVLLAQTLQQEQLKVTQYWLNGYDEQALKQYGKLMDGVYFLIGHTPFELGAAALPRYPGMPAYLSALARYFPSDTPSESSLAGWVNADLFVTALRKVGRDLTRSRLISAINSMTDYTASGLVSPISWAAEHDANGPFDCNVFIQVRSGRFVPVFGSPPSVFTCFQYPQPAVGTIAPIRPPVPVPGA